MERRTLNHQTTEIRATDKGKTISGYAARFYDGTPGTEFELWANAVERLLPGAFDRTINEGDDTRALFNHNPDHLLGRRSAGTLTLSVDERGLRYEIKPPDTQIGRDVAEMVGRGDVTGSSFGFVVTDETWRKENGVRIREIRGVRLYDVSPVTFPAYGSTSATVRAAGDLDEAKRSFDKHESELAARLRGFAVRARLAEIGL